MLLAYKYVGIAVMLAEVNFCAQRLELGTELPITHRDLRAASVTPPQVMRFGGRLETDKFFFGFNKTGRLRYVAKFRPFGQLTVAEQNEVLSAQKSVITTNEAYSLATNWLVALSVDVALLEKTNRPAVQQRVAGADPRTQKLLPIFHVRWGEWDHAKIKVSIDGRNKELLELRQEDDSFSHRPPELIKDRDALLAIPDDDFRAYSAEQRRTLVARFAAVSYPGTAPFAGTPSQTNADHTNRSPPNR